MWIQWMWIPSLNKNKRMGNIKLSNDLMILYFWSEKIKFIQDLRIAHFNAIKACWLPLGLLSSGRVHWHPNKPMVNSLVINMGTLLVLQKMGKCYYFHIKWTINNSKRCLKKMCIISISVFGQIPLSKGGKIHSDSNHFNLITRL